MKKISSIKLLWCRITGHSGHRRWRVFKVEGPKHTFYRWCERCQCNIGQYMSKYYPPENMSYKEATGEEY